MGRSFRWLIASVWTSNLGDGIALAAGPLLVATQTHQPFLVASAAMLQQLPWLIFGLFAGAIADRVDRRLLVIIADTARMLVVAALVVTIETDKVSIGVVLGAMFLLGTAECFADSASSTLLPMVVGRNDLGIGNARLQAGQVVGNQFFGPPLGAFLFAVGMAWPFFVQIVVVSMGIVLIGKVTIPKTLAPSVRSHLITDIAEGVRWLLGNAAVRTLALVILVFNVTWGAAWSVLVLYSLVHLHMGELGFGLLTSSTAVGGVVGTLSFGWLEGRFSLATLMRACLLLEVAMHLSLALTTVGWVAMVIMFVFGAYAFVWATVSQTIRHRAVPPEFQGRVGSVYFVGLVGGLVIGQALGGWIASGFGLTAPFWFAFVGAGVTLLLVWRQLGHIAMATAD
jgi:MFS family permease